MSIEEAIIELLKVNNRVIVPGFGAFLNAKDDGVDKAYVVFNSFLSFNDGLLVGCLAERNQIDTIVATEQVTEFVALIKSALASERIYEFHSLGSFDYEDGGSTKLRFNQYKGEILASIIGASKKIEPANLEPIVAEDPKIIESKKEELKPVETLPQPAPSVDVPIVVEQKIEKVSPPIVVPEKPEIKVEEKKVDEKVVSKSNATEHASSTVAKDDVTINSTPLNTDNSGLNESRVESVEEKYARFSNSASKYSSQFDSKLEDKYGKQPTSQPISQPVSKPVLDTSGSKKAEVGLNPRKVTFLLYGLFTVALLVIGYLFFIHLPNQREEVARKLAIETEAENQIIQKQKQQADSLAKTQLVLKQQSDSIATLNLPNSSPVESVKLSAVASPKVNLPANNIKLSGAASSKGKLQAYHIIVGAQAATDEASVDALVAKIKTSNFPHAQKLTGNNRYFVSVEFFSDFSAAMKQVELIKKKLQMDATVYTVL